MTGYNKRRHPVSRCGAVHSTADPPLTPCAMPTLQGDGSLWGDVRASLDPLNVGFDAKAGLTGARADP
jgi:hypothetical protein